MADRSSLAALLAAMDTTASGFTMVELASGVRLVGSALEGVSAHLVLSGTLHAELGTDRQVVRQGSLLLVPSRVRPAMAADALSLDRGAPLDGEHCSNRRSGWQVADATLGGARTLTLAAARITGTAGVLIDTPLILPVAESAAGRHIVDLLRDELARREGSQALAASLMGACIGFGLRDRMEKRRSDHRLELLARAIAAVNARPGDAHSLDSLAQVAGMSRATFSRQFARLIGTSPMDYIQRKRLEEAAAMLRATDLPIHQIATHTGFASRSHFSRAFRTAFGSDPSAYRGEISPA